LTEKIELEIVTPEQLLFSGEVEEVVVPGSEGYLGILPGHAPLLSELQIGVISYRQDSQETKVFCSRGFVEVLPDRVSILAEAAELPDQIDVEQARAQQVEAEQQLRSDDPDTDYAQALLDLREAQIRLDLAEQSTAT
jgi:F-type H+-transporting ATPase subunit epsilon